ncbi:MAG: autotransporter domain-containing protein [Phyllobacteriaceae bacterium]|nr:autotransporter domain-containing protein [Kiritimatiellia bacterium]MCO5134487.1 autotransporter domain-containing protein [Phyllobacteriaceae bacterium]
MPGKQEIDLRSSKRNAAHFSRIAFALAVVLPNPAIADDLVIGGPTSLTNGGFTIDGNDTLIVTGLGSITPPSGSPGIASAGGNNILRNDGGVATAGDSAAGIDNSTSSQSQLTNNGSISTIGHLSYGIANRNSDNSSIVNNGSVSTAGISSNGIFNDFSLSSPILNQGEVKTGGSFAHAIFNNFSSGSSITNTGVISTEGFNASGIWNNNSDDSPVANAGSITTNNDNSHGIWNSSSTRSPTTNSGSIRTTGDHSYGIWNNLVTDGSPVSNSGSIVTTNSFAHGIWNNYSNGSPITSSGSIRTGGNLSHGIWSANSTNSAVTVSGRVIASHTNADAIRMDDADGILNLDAPAYLGGAINFLAPTTVNLKTGPSHSVAWDLSLGSMVGGDPASISGPVPWFYDSSTKVFATYDPSGLAGAVNSLADMTGQLSQVGRSALVRPDKAMAGAGTVSGFAASTVLLRNSDDEPDITDRPADESMDEVLGTYAAGLDALGRIYNPAPGRFWVTHFGGMFEHDGDGSTVLDQEFRQAGFAAGYSWQQSASLMLGVMAGYLTTDLGVESRWAPSHDIESEGWFAGLFGKQDAGAYRIDFGITGGILSHDHSRFINDNTAISGGSTLGRDGADASYNSWFLAPEIGIATDLSQGNGVTVTPSARIRYSMQSIDGFAESGSTAAARVDARDLGMVEASAEIAATKILDFGSVTGRLGYLMRSNTGDEAVSISMLGITNSVGFGDTDSNAAYLGLGATFDLTANSSLVLEGQGYFSGGIGGYQGMARLAISF